MLFILIIPFFGCVFSQDFIQEPNIIQVGEYTNSIYSIKKNYTEINFNKKKYNSFILDDINIKYIVNNMRLIKININFKKIFLIPKCFVKIKDKSIFLKNIIQNKTLNYLYSTVNLSMNIENISCFNKIEIICTLIKQNFTIEIKNNTCISDSTSSTVIILIILFLISPIILNKKILL